MSTVWILGAGASRAEHEMMPLVDDFMRIALELGRFKDYAGEGFLDSLCEDFGFTRKHLMESVNVEELLTLAACDASWQSIAAEANDAQYSLPRAIGALATIDSLAHLIAGVLFEIQPRVFAREKTLHDRLVAAMNDGDAILTYNYDLLIDHALSKAKRLTSGSYYLRFDRSVEGSDFGPATLSELEVETPGPIPLLKLHGSLNWLRLQHEALSSSQEFMFSEHPMFYLRDGFSVWVPPGNHGRAFNLKRKGYEPGKINYVGLSCVVVPPTFDKANIWRETGGQLRELWSQARHALESSDCVVLIGHSLREADYQTRWLLRVGLASRVQERQVVIVNPSSSDQSRIADFFAGLGRIVCYSDLETFLAAEDA